MATGLGEQSRRARSGPVGLAGIGRRGARRDPAAAAPSGAGCTGPELEVAPNEAAMLARAAAVAGLGGWRLDLETGRIALSARTAQLLGLRGQPQSVDLAALLGPMPATRRRIVLRGLERARRGRSLRIELPITVDGAVRWIRLAARPVPKSGGAVALDGGCEDVTARRLAEARRKSLERALNEAQALAGIAAWWTDVATGEVRWSDKLHRILGYEFGEVSPSFEAYARSVHPDDLPAYWARIRAGATESQTYRAEYRIVRPDGQVRRVLATSRPVHDRLGQLIGRFGVIQDVTEAREAEERLQTQTAMLHEAQRLARIGAVWRRVDQPVSCWSDELYRILGLDPARTTPSFETFRQLVHPDDRQKHRRLIEDLTFDHDTEGEFRIIRPDGEERTLLVRCRLDHRDNGTPYLYATHLDITELKQAERRLETLAFFDALTGLPNRASFHRRLEELVAAPAPAGANRGALLLLDLDRFKEVNDTLGHAAGDRLLVVVAERLRRAVRDSDVVARLGGDEFAVIARSPIDANAVVSLADRLLMTLRADLEIEGQEIHVGGSIGIAIVDERPVDAATLLRRADLALYAVKEAGRDGYRFFEPGLNDAVVRRRTIESELRQAIRDDALALHYQPQLDIASDRICGVEALLRWPGADGAYLPPDQFVPIAESCGLITELGAWVIERGIAEFARLRHETSSDLTLALNVSVAQLQDAALPARIEAALRHHGLPPARLHLEVTESVFADRRDGRIMAGLDRLGQLGVTLCLDDFGTGYSSLGYLADLPFRVLKVDRRFTASLGHDRRSGAIVPAIIGLGRSLGLTVVAEGVERDDQLDRLRGFGCDVAQGYLIGRPRPLGAIIAWLRSGATRSAQDGPCPLVA